MIGETLVIFYHHVQYIKVEALPSKEKKNKKIKTQSKESN